MKKRLSNKDAEQWDADAGKLYAWGGNGQGQLGLGDLNTRLVPTPVSHDLTFKTISAGLLHSMAITGVSLTFDAW